MFRRIFKRRERMIGSSRKKRQYDLPLNRGSGTGFLILIVGLMTFLGLLSVGGAMTLSSIQQRWSSGLENRVTIEVPSEMNGSLLTEQELNDASQRLIAMLQAHPSVLASHPMSQEEILSLVTPWLGDTALLQNIPLPAVISVLLSDSDASILAGLSQQVKEIASHARLDTHETWLQDILKFAGALKFVAALLVAIIGFTTFTAVASAVRARMDIYKDDVQLLHLMGASDTYIARQFQRYAMLASLKGALVGTIIGVLLMCFISIMASRMNINMMPQIEMDANRALTFVFIPLIAMLISMITARMTVLRVLIAMP
jgi:cell division transport system permease protein